MLFVSAKRTRSRNPISGLSFDSLETRRLLATVAVVEGPLEPVPVHDVQSSAENITGQTLPTDLVVQRIVNGQQTSQFPAVGILGPLGCTGTLISPTHVLTAAHCLVGVGNTQASFRVEGATYRSVQVTLHPDYNPQNFSAGNDLAIVELSRTVSGVTPADILRSAPTVGTQLTLVGFGEGGTSTGGFDPTDTGKQVGRTELEQVTQHHLRWVFDSHQEANTAPGDSGGPAFVRVDGEFLIAGVTSGGTGVAQLLGDRSFDTRIDVHADWIDRIAGLTPDDSGGGDGGTGGGGSGGGTGGGGTGGGGSGGGTGGTTGGGGSGGGTISTTDDHLDQPTLGSTRLTIDGNRVTRAGGTIGIRGDRDSFSFVVPASGQTTFTVRGLSNGFVPYLRLYRSGSRLAGQAGTAGSSSAQLNSQLTPGTWYAVVAGFQDRSVGNYTLSIQHDANSSSPTTAPATSGGTFSNNRSYPISSSGITRAISPIDVSNRSGRVTDANITLNINHTSPSDLRLVLIAPDKTRVILVSQQSGGGRNFSGTTFDQSAAQLIRRATAPYSGTFRPAHNLNQLTGVAPNGRWRLVAMDFANRNGGALRNWSLEIETTTSRTAVSPPLVARGLAVAFDRATETTTPEQRAEEPSIAASPVLSGSQSLEASVPALAENGYQTEPIRRSLTLDEVFSRFEHQPLEQ